MTTLIFAPNQHAAALCAKDHGLSPSDYEFIGSADAMRGRATKDQPRIFVKGFEQRHDADRIRLHLRIADQTPGVPLNP